LQSKIILLNDDTRGENAPEVYCCLVTIRCLFCWILF